MASQIVVEILDGRGRVHARTRLHEFPATIGRAYTSDIIIDDPYVDAEHLRLSRVDSGPVTIEDAGSVNGTFEAGSKARVTRVEVKPGLELKIGHSHLRFQDPTHPLPPTLVERSDLSYDRLGQRQIAIPVALLTVLWFAVSGWFSSYERTTVLKQVAIGVFVLVILATWAGIWSLASRMIQHRFNFIAHLTLASMFLIATDVVDVVGSWLGVIAPATRVETAVGLIAGIPLIFALITGHLALASALSTHARRRAALGIMVGFAALYGLTEWSTRDDFESELEYPATIRPVPTNMLSKSPPEEFFGKATELREKVDERAKKANEKLKNR